MTSSPTDSPDPISDAAVFWALRQAPLHDMTGAQWDSYYPSMAAWLWHADAEIRACAVERLVMAALFAEHAREDRAGSVSPADRLAWLLYELTSAQVAHSDVLPAFLSELRYHGDREPYRTPLLAWLEALARQCPDGVDIGMIEGAKLLVAGANAGELSTKLGEWVALLDHGSDYVRGCAARLLGLHCGEDTIPDLTTLKGVVGAKEIERPGIAGPFWSNLYFGDAAGEKTALWMLDLLEARKGPVPSCMPFNDIEFYLHELCSSSPDLMLRMLRGGFVELALETATEVRSRVDGVQPVLEMLAANADPAIAEGAKWHLSTYYS